MNYRNCCNNGFDEIDSCNFRPRPNCCLEGPIGPQGPAGTNDVIYAGVGTSTVATDEVIPIALINATPDTTMSVSNNAVNLADAGTYIVSFSVDGSTTAENLSATLYLNGAPITNESVIESSNGALASASKTALITTTGASTLSIYNTSTADATLNNASIMVLKTA